MIKLPTLIRPSTRAWLREVRRTKNYSFFDTLHGYIYGRWPYFYISVGTGEHPLARFIGPAAAWLITRITHSPKDEASQPQPAQPVEDAVGMAFANSYHGKVVPLESAKQLVSIQQDIRILDLEKVIPYDRARDIILFNPDHIVALDCPCRVAREHPCLPLDVCLIVGEPFASFIIEHQPSHARWITSGEAVDILKAEDERGHVHHAFFKDAMLGRFYAICNCCDCCCGAMQAQRAGTPMLASSGYRATVDLELCKGCATCTKFCQFHAISMTGSGSGSQSQIDPTKCMGCGVCISHCTKNALSLQREPGSGEPLEIHKLMDRML